MIKNKINKSFQASLYILFIFIFSCNESDSVVISPPNANSFQVKSFLIDTDNSYAFRQIEFNAGNSLRSYVGNVENYTESKLLVKIDKDLIASNDLCQDQDINFNSLELRLWLKNPILTNC